MTDRRETACLTPEVRLVLTAIAYALCGRLPNPDLLNKIAARYCGAVPGHQSKIERRPRPPKGTKPRLKAIYTLSINGSRVDGRWNFTPGQLANILRSLTKDHECGPSEPVEANYGS